MKQLDAAHFNEIGKTKFPDFLGIHLEEVEGPSLKASMEIKDFLFAPNGFVHAGSIITLADTLAGYASIANLPENAKSFTTIELKTNFLGAVREGTLVAETKPIHLGRTTHIWNVMVSSKETGKKVALFSCTQLILY